MMVSLIAAIGVTYSWLKRTSVRAKKAFLASCPVLLRRQDPSGLTRPEDWRDACAEDEAVNDRSEEDRAQDFFRARFEVIQVGAGDPYFTGFERAVIRATEELVQDKVLSEASWRSLKPNCLALRSNASPTS